VKGIDTMPKGPVNWDYKFDIVYYTAPLGGRYRAIIEDRLKSGIPASMAGDGLPIAFSTVRTIAMLIRINRSHAKYENFRIGDNSMNAYDVVEHYLINNLSMMDIGKKAGCSEGKIKKILMAMGVENLRAYRKGKRTKRQQRADKPTNMEVNKKWKPQRNVFLAKWRQKYWHKYGKAYEEVAKGATIKQTCKKHGVDINLAYYHFKRLQINQLAYLDWGQKRAMPIYISKARLKQWEYVAKLSHNSVLDWALHTLNAIADREDNMNDSVRTNNA